MIKNRKTAAILKNVQYVQYVEYPDIQCNELI